MRTPGFLTTPEFLGGTLSGLLLAVACPPTPLWPLGYVALVPLLAAVFAPHRIRVGSPLRLRTLVLSFGLTLHLGQLHWLLFLGEASPLEFKWAMPLLWLLLGFFQTAYDLILLWVLARLRGAFGMQAIWCFPGLWVGAEWLRAQGELGFPWLRLSTTQLELLPVLQLAGLLGELGVSLFVAWVNVLLVVGWMGFRGGFPSLGGAVVFRGWAPVALVLLFSGVLFYGVRVQGELEDATVDAPGLTLGVVQANVDLMDKWDPAKRDSTFVPYGQLSRAAVAQGARLLVWPETAIPLDLPRSERYLPVVRELVRSTQAQLLAGFPERQFSEEGRIVPYNSSFLMDEDGILQGRYRKMRLLPFGERLPFQDLFPFLGRLDLGQAEWASGPEQTVFQVDGHRFVVLICFESIFPQIARRGAHRGAGFLVNITNDGWFGDTALPWQHASMSVLRAVENRMPLVRCANNGVSFVVAPDGQVLDRTGLFTREWFVRTIHPRPGGSVYTRHGDRTIFLLVLAGFGLFFLMRRAARAA